MSGNLSFAIMFLVTVSLLLSAHPTYGMPIHRPSVDSHFIPSLQNTNGYIHAWTLPQPQEESLDKEAAETQHLGAILGRVLLRKALNTIRNRQTPSDTSSMQADLDNFAKGENIDLDGLTDQLQNILNSQPSASTPTESVAEAQSRYWPMFRNFLDNVFSPTEAPSEQPNTNALAENLESTFNQQILTGAERQPVVRTQLLSSINKIVGDLFAPKCSDALYIMAYTGQHRHAFTTDTPSVELQVGDEITSVSLPDLPGEEFVANKGDLWRINLSDFGFTDTCVTKGDVQRITLVEGGTDGWLIDSVVTFLRTEDSFVPLSSDIDVNRWIDGNRGSEVERFNLSIV